LPRIIALDSGPAWLACLAPGKPEADRCRAWIAALKATGARIVLPEVVDYETRRELLRSKATAGLRRLDSLRADVEYLPISTPAMVRAAELWADARNTGKVTAPPEALDGDCIVAAQTLVAAGPGVVPIVATNNVKHLIWFPGVDAREWMTIA
jgi:predicted nucleic acid-binding protein